MSQLEELFKKLDVYSKALQEAEKVKAQEQTAKEACDKEISEIDTKIEAFRATLDAAKVLLESRIKGIWDNFSKYFILNPRRIGYRYFSIDLILMGKCNRIFDAPYNHDYLNESDIISDIEDILSEIKKQSILQNYEQILHLPEEEQYKIFKISLLENLKIAQEKYNHNSNEYFKTSGEIDELEQQISELPTVSKFRRKKFKEVDEKRNTLTHKIANEKDYLEIVKENRELLSKIYTVECERIVAGDEEETKKYIASEIAKIKEIIEGISEYKKIISEYSEECADCNVQINNLYNNDRKKAMSQYTVVKKEFDDKFCHTGYAKMDYEKEYQKCLTIPYVIEEIAKLDMSKLSEEQKQVIAQIQSEIYEKLAQKLND